jgi:hypothetical protein
MILSIHCTAYAILKLGSRRPSDDFISVTVESGMVENAEVAIGISLLSYSVTEIQCTSRVGYVFG